MCIKGGFFRVSFFNPFVFFLSDHPPFARLELPQAEVADLDADEPQGGEADGGGHVADLAVLALGEGEAHPAGGDVGAIADRGYSLPEVLRWQRFLGLAGAGAVPFDDDPFGQLLQRLVADFAIHLGEVGARVGVLRVQQPLDKPAIVGQQQGALAVVVEPSRGIDAGREAKPVEGGMSRLGSELAQHAVGFVEEDDHDGSFWVAKIGFFGKCIGVAPDYHCDRVRCRSPVLYESHLLFAKWNSFG